MQGTQTTTQSLKIFNNKYIVKKKISSGSFGVVFLGYDKLSKEDVAIKLEKENNEEIKSLEREVQIMTHLQGVQGIPKFYWSGQEQDYNILIMQLLGSDLSYQMKSLKKFSLKTVLQLAEDCVSILERMHLKGVVHRDLKPENIVIGRENDPQSVYIIDFGISKFFRDLNTKQHIPFNEQKPFIGTTRYASIAAHKGQEIARKDDLESLFYVLIYFLRGSLPWQNLQVPERERTKAVGDIKQRIDLNELCKGFPLEFVQIFEYIRKLAFKQDPDYKIIIQFIQKMAQDNQIALDVIYDWTDVKNKFMQKSSFDSRVSDAKPQSSHNIQLPVAISSKHIIVMNNQIAHERQVNSSRISQKIIWSINEQAQNSGMLLSSQNNLLVPPDPNKQAMRQSLKQSFPGRIEGRNYSSFSIASQQGTYSSMKLKYIPSNILFDSSFEPQTKEKRKSGFKQTISLSIQKAENDMLHIQFEDEEADLGNIEENYQEEPLWQRYYKLKILSTNLYFKHSQKFKDYRNQIQIHN